MGSLHLLTRSATCYHSGCLHLIIVIKEGRKDEHVFSRSRQSNEDEYQPNENEEKNPYPSTETQGNSRPALNPIILSSSAEEAIAALWYRKHGVLICFHFLLLQACLKGQGFFNTPQFNLTCFLVSTGAPGTPPWTPPWIMMELYDQFHKMLNRTQISYFLCCSGGLPDEGWFQHPDSR